MRALFVSCFFPPTGGGGVQRILKLLKYLPRHGWESEVVAADESSPWIRDDSLLEEVPKSVAVHRVPLRLSPGRIQLDAPGLPGGARPTARYDRLRRLAGWGLVPDGYLPWVPSAVKAVRRLLKTGRFDALVTTSPPDSAHLVGLWSGTDVPWVADFRDPWTQRIHFHPPTPLHRAIDARLEASVMRRASGIIAVTPNMQRDFLTRYPSLGGRLHAITNGFDPDDIPSVPRPVPADRPLQILHTGTLTLKRTIAPLAAALEHLFKDSPELIDHIRITILGGWDDCNEKIIQSAGISPIVSLERSVPHGESLRRQARADALLLLDAGGAGSELTVPGKLYEYLGSRRPILAFGAPGGVGQILSTTKAGACFDPESPLEAASFIGAWIQSHRGGGIPWDTDPASYAKYDRRHIAGQFAEVLNGVAH